MIKPDYLKKDFLLKTVSGSIISVKYNSNHLYLWGVYLLGL